MSPSHNEAKWRCSKHSHTESFWWVNGVSQAEQAVYPQSHDRPGLVSLILEDAVPK